MASLPLRVRIRPHAPLPTQPFLLPVLPSAQQQQAGGSSQASSASSSSIETVADLARHLASKLDAQQGAEAVQDSIALYLDGFRLIDWHYRVHDVLREADVLE